MKLPIHVPMLALAILGALLSVSTLASAKDDGGAIAQSPTLPGRHNADGHGADFAPELYKRLTAAGGEAYLISFKWRQEFEKADLDRSGTMVVFRDDKGLYWGMDLSSEHPLQMPSKDPQKCLRRMYPALLTSVTDIKTDSKLEGQYADLSRSTKTTTSSGTNATTPPVNSTTRVVDSVVPMRVPR